MVFLFHTNVSNKIKVAKQPSEYIYVLLIGEPLEVNYDRSFNTNLISLR